MKTYFNCILTVISIGLFHSCSEPDSDSPAYSNINVNSANLIQIETVSSYKLNDLIYINANFSRYLPEDGFDDLLDIFKTTNSNEYTFYFSLEKKSAYDTWNQINFGDKIVVDKGKSYSSYYDVGICVFNPENNKYEFRAGLPLLETGQFRLQIDRELNPVYTNHTKIPIYIYTTISQVDNQGYYNFTVN